MITRDEAMVLLTTYAKDDHQLIKKSFAVEHIMKNLAGILEEDEALWMLTGLLHDLDEEYTQRNPERHTKITSELLKGMVPEPVIQAIQSHNYLHTGVIPTSLLSKALLASDAAVTLIYLVMKHKEVRSIHRVSKKDVLHAYLDTSFDPFYEKDWLFLINDLNLSVNDFLLLSLSSMKEISVKLKNA